MEISKITAAASKLLDNRIVSGYYTVGLCDSDTDGEELAHS
jgi:hypothetical protein